MERRTFIARGLALAGGGIAAGLAGIGPARAAPKTLFSQSFSLLEDTDAGWGPQWFSQRYGRAWGVKDGLAFFEMPDPQFGAAKSFPNPVLVLDQDVAGIDLKARMSSRNPNARFGLIARAVSYGDFYACYVDGLKLIVSRFSGKEEHVLAAGELPRPGKFGYFIRLAVAGAGPVVLQAKAWPGDALQPPFWHATATDESSPITEPGAFGALFMHDDWVGWKANVKTSSFAALSPEVARPSIPSITFAFAGRITETAGVIRTRVVAKTAIPAQVQFQWSTDPAFGTYQTTPVLDPKSKLCVVKAWLTDLPRAAKIHWRAVATTAGGAIVESPIKSFNTPPAKDQALSFAFGSCTDYEIPTRSCEVAATLNPDVFVHMGDFGYAMTGAEAAGFRTADAYQDRWGRMLASSSVGKVLDKMPWIMLQDDQDYGKGNCWSGNVPEFSVGAWNAISGNLKQRYFAMRFGDAHFFFIDTHRWADDPKAPDGPGRTILGGAQKAWLKQTMAASDAALKVLFSPVPLRHMQMHYSEEHAEMLAFFSSIQSHGRKVLVCAGNSHLHNIARRRPASGGSAVNTFVSSGSDKTNQKSAPGAEAGKTLVYDVNAFAYVRLEQAWAYRKLYLACIASDTGEVIMEREIAM